MVEGADPVVYFKSVAEGLPRGGSEGGGGGGCLGLVLGTSELNVQCSNRWTSLLPSRLGIYFQLETYFAFALFNFWFTTNFPSTWLSHSYG